MKLQTIFTYTPIGWVKLQATDTHLICCNWVKEPDTTVQTTQSSILEEAVRQLNEYFAGERKVFNLPLSQVGTSFQHQVWDELRNIPYGERITYAQLAECIGKGKACRAVGSANGKNNIFIIVPCHRVVQSGGKAGGFAYGTEMKQYLLDLEKKNN